MLIINADDFGIAKDATENILACHQREKITSTSAMVFMEDSERAASLVSDVTLQVGLHINFTESFNGTVKLNKLREYQNQIKAFLNKGKYQCVFYNPFLTNQFEYVYNAQYDEFFRLYNKHPSHIDGHHHMHLCTNMLFQNLIKSKNRVRTTFSFKKKEKNEFNRLYRRIISYWISKRFISTDYLYSIEPILAAGKLRAKCLYEVACLAKSALVELSVHPQRRREYDYLMSDEFSQILMCVKADGEPFLKCAVSKRTN